MAIETGLRTLLLAQTGITAIAAPQTINGVTYQGIFNNNAVQGFKPPFVLITQMDMDPLKALDGTYGLRFDDFDIDAYSRDYPEAHALAQLIEDFLKDYNGPAGPSDTIKAVLLDNRQDDEVFEAQGADQRQYIVSLSFQIQHQPTVGV